MTREDVRISFEKYMETLAEVDRLDVSVRTQRDWDTWYDALIARADFLHRQYTQAQAPLEETFAALDADDGSLPDDVWQLFRDSLHALYASPVSDLAMVKRGAELLLQGGKRRGNMEFQMQAYMYLGFANVEYSRIVRQGFGDKAVYYYKKAADVWNHYGETASTAIHEAIVISLINLCITCVPLGDLSPEEGYRYWQIMQHLRQSPAFAQRREAEPRMAQLLDAYVESYKADAYAIAVTPKKPFSPALRETLMSMAEDAYAEFLKEPEWKAGMFQALIIKLECEKSRGHKTARECWDTLHRFYYATHEKVAAEEDIDVISYYATCLEALIELLAECDMPRAEKRSYFAGYQQEIQTFINNYSRNIYTLNSALEVLAFLPQSYMLFDTAEEKIDFLYRLVTVRHCTTFLHCQMVCKFAEAILSAMIADTPELLVGYHGLQDVPAVRAQREALLSFIHNAALLHDMGKNAMLTIIETQHRRLTDDEFAIIRQHPRKGAEYLSIDPDLAKYRDIACGHHKFYNGQGGYPADFDNTASPERIMIDVVTLADCLDAATDCYGRNFHSAKTVDQVLEEFRRDSGVRYHPDITSLMCDSAPLRQTLVDIAGKQRIEIYYDTYQKYFM